MRPRFCECGQQIKLPYVDECSACKQSDSVRAWPERQPDPNLPPVVSIELDRPAWQARAACFGADPTIFFPERGEPTTLAKEMCRSCPVRDECLAHAMAHNEKFGIWGGTSERERRRMRARAAKQAS